MTNYVKVKLAYNTDAYSNEAINVVNTDEYVFYTATIPDFPYADDDFAHAYHNFDQIHTNYKKATLYLPVLFIVFLVILTICIHLAGYSKTSTEPVTIGYDKVYLEIATCITLGSFYFLITALFKLINSDFQDNNEYFLRLLSIYIALYPIIIYNLFSFVRRSKCKTLLATMLTAQIFQKVHHLFHTAFYSKKLATQAICVATLYLIGIICTVLSFQFFKTPYLGIVLLIVLYLLLTRYLLKKAASLSYLIEETKKISDGDLNHKINEEYVTQEVHLLANYINTIGDGFSKAVEEKLKSERFKTELITNVSHDIKTPLTSIINYVDLLKKEGNTSDAARSYIEVLDTKSQRLKTLIEDLVEASKASSGAITMHMQKLNLVELIKQTIGEFEDRLEEHNLTIDLEQINTPLYIYADGRSTYRILENILSNVYKYAMAGTRVYIDVKEDEDTIIISVKNISANRLNITADELMERFVRGDLSRSTEGSGLGLSIAQSLAALQNATFKIDLDGDLFKAIVSFPRIY